LNLFDKLDSSAKMPRFIAYFLHKKNACINGNRYNLWAGLVKCLILRHDFDR
jgi:hypothetical protein